MPKLQVADRVQYLGRPGSASPRGREIPNLPDDVQELWSEIRDAQAAGASTLAVLGCRTLLMHLAVDAATKEGESDKDFTFKQAVNYLSENHYLPRNTEGWAHRVRDEGNEATHELAMKNTTEATDLMNFCAALLTFMYEFTPPESGAADDTQGPAAPGSADTGAEGFRGSPG